MPTERDIRGCTNGKEFARMLLNNEVFYLVLPDPEEHEIYPFYIYTDRDKAFKEVISSDTVYEVHNGECKEIHQ